MIKRLVKLSCLFLPVLFFAVCAAGQTTSQCAFGGAPRLLDLSLGMSPAEVRNVFGKDLKIKVKSSGDRTFFQNYIGKPARGKLAGVRALYLRFLDGRLYQIEVFYEQRSDASTLEAFTVSLAAAMNLPAEAGWQFANDRALVDCGAFMIIADKPVDPRVELTDTARLTEAEARRKKK